MKIFRLMLASVALLAALAGNVAHAHGGHHGHGHGRPHVELFIGVPLAGSWHYRDPYYIRQPPVMVVPPVVTVPSSPPVYIEQNAGAGRQPSSQQSDGNWWYYCPTQRSYYPYVRVCPQGWQLVAPQPPDLR